MIPLTIELTPNGKTLVFLFPSKIQGMLVAKFLNILGEPEMICTGETNSEIIEILFPHQDMPEELYEVAERFTTAHLLEFLGYSMGS